MNTLTFPIIFMLVCIYIEAILLKWIKKQNINWLDIIFNLNSGHIVLWLFRGLEILCYAYVYQNCSLNLFSSTPVFYIWIFAVFAWDFCFYWQHRLLHTYRLLYAVHLIHHQGENFNLSLAVRNSWYSSLLSAVFNVGLAFLGLPTEIFLAVSMIHYSIQFFNHNDFTPRLGFLEKIFVTPNHHRVHHINDRYYSNRNFGGSFIIWDKLFGSYAEMPEGTVNYGSPGVKTFNPLLASNFPFMQIFKIRFQPSSFPNKFVISNLLMTLGSTALFILAISYIYTYGYGLNDISLTQYILFAYLAGGTIFLGAMSEGRPWGIIGWIILTITMPLLFLYGFQWHQTYWQITMALLSIHGIIIFINWIRVYRKSLPVIEP